MSSLCGVTVRRGDCLLLMRRMPESTVDLAYLDPPFFTQKVHRLAPRDGSRPFSFSDRWASQQQYEQFLLDRLAEVHRLLAPHGSVFVHCDRNATHLACATLDAVFGRRHFRAEIIWCYRRWSNARRALLPAHQTIYYYSKSDQYTFHPLRTEYSPATNVDQILQRRTRDGRNKSVYQRDGCGNLVYQGPKRGVPLGDVWDIPYLNPKAKERSGYPTQKPLSLLERILALATNEGDLVLDPFCGSGTTLVAARSMRRRAIGIDISRDAVELTRRRLRRPVRSESMLLAVGREAYRNAERSALALLAGIDCVPVERNAGIDAILGEGFGGAPVPIRVQRADESIAEAAARLARAASTKGANVMFLVATQLDSSVDAGLLPPGVIVVSAPALSIRERLAERALHRLRT